MIMVTDVVLAMVVPVRVLLRGGDAIGSHGVAALAMGMPGWLNPAFYFLNFFGLRVSWVVCAISWEHESFHFTLKVLFHRFNGVQNVTSFKLNHLK